MVKEKKQHRKKTFLWIAMSLLVLGIGGLLLGYFLWFKPGISKPLAETLNLPTNPVDVSELTEEPEPTSENGNSTADVTEATATQSLSGQPIEQSATPTSTKDVPVYVKPTVPVNKEPICGKDSEWIVLLVGIDYQGDGYLYGLADVIRLVRIDFINGTINMIGIPRDLLVDVPEQNLSVEGPIKINQAYLFGTKGMGHYSGSGYGAGSLAEVIQYNLGVSADHYGVINFDTFVKFIDAIGGIDVDLPQAVTDPEFGDYHAGKQWLSGERALKLARIRTLYSDAFRVSNQTIIMRAVLNKMMTPAMILKMPGLLIRFKDAFLTDLSIEQLTSLGLCFLNKFDSSNLKTYTIPPDLLTSDSVYIPTLSNRAFVYRWDDRLIRWLHDALVAE
jgi:LCP family protein required for cell wall assembly